MRPGRTECIVLHQLAFFWTTCFFFGGGWFSIFLIPELAILQLKRDPPLEHLEQTSWFRTRWNEVLVDIIGSCMESNHPYLGLLLCNTGGISPPWFPWRVSWAWEKVRFGNKKLATARKVTCSEEVNHLEIVEFYLIKPDTLKKKYLRLVTLNVTTQLSHGKT